MEEVLIMVFPDAYPTPDADTILRLTKGLEQMRDSLVKLSLVLQDVRFEYYTHKRAEANRSAAQMLHKIGSSEGGKSAS